MVNNQMQLMNSLPELHAKGVDHIYYKVQNILQELDQSKNTLSNENESLAYMKELITNTEQESQRKSVWLQEDMILLQRKCKETLDLMQKKLEARSEKCENTENIVEQLKRENEKIQKDSDKIIDNTKAALNELLQLMNNHFRIVSDDTKLLDGLKDMTENLPDVRKMCEKFMTD